MGIQDKIAKSQIGARLKLRDYKVSQMGTKALVIRLKVEENRYGDETIEIINDDTIEVSLDMPDEIPYQRLRSDVTQEVATSESLFLYDILPVEGYAAHNDNVEKGDILVHIVKDGRSDKKMYLVLRVSEVIGTVQIGYITGRKFNCAPHNMPLPEQAQQIIDNYGDSV